MTESGAMQNADQRARVSRTESANKFRRALQSKSTKVSNNWVPRRALRASGVILRHDALILDTGCTQAMHYKPPSKGKMTESNIRDHKSVYQGFGKSENMTMESHVQATVTYHEMD